ncbi:D-aspartate oxidase-like isoform X1 [Haliotis rufescens]|uniref:D-aspartate oxidase-like isoform X1 n=2 Tax=Haliotis rufescens TaxID=6454 RepID=UPI00201E83A1|nr:D-aspartate oxidase-like isoform X1 [Haliotis rufescens]
MFMSVHPSMMVLVCVVGAGIVGLSTALNIQRLIPSAQITIIADKFGNDTTSAGAGGLFRPNLGHIKGVPIDTLKRWSKISWKHFSTLALSSEASTSGNNVTNGFVLQDTEEPQFLNEIIFSYHKLSRDELQRLNSNQKHGYNITTVITEAKKYLPWLMRKYKDNGGQVVFRTLTSLEELCGEYKVVANCCGLNAKYLLGDESTYPIRGQLIRMRAPWIRGFYYIEHDGYSTYAIPHSDYMILGGCREVGNYSEDIDPALTEDILRRGKEKIPGLEGARVVDQWAGLRPTRIPIRVAKEHMTFGGTELKVVHNYGHGANGISLSWSTAVDAAQMVKEMVDNASPSSKL